MVAITADQVMYYKNWWRTRKEPRAEPSTDTIEKTVATLFARIIERIRRSLIQKATVYTALLIAGGISILVIAQLFWVFIINAPLAAAGYPVAASIAYTIGMISTTFGGLVAWFKYVGDRVMALV